ncbi:unnamed protein product [Effrenium voratum]|nr:unnamed protein product [Effrenium voratum]
MADAPDAEVDFQAPSLKVPLPAFPLEDGGARGQAWPEHLSRKDPFARWRKGASRFYAPAAFDPFEEWRHPDFDPRVAQGQVPPPFTDVPSAGAQPEMRRSCHRCDAVLSPDANFCGRCGLARSTGRGYQHPEKLLPGPPLRHDPMEPAREDRPQPQPPQPQPIPLPVPEPQSFASQMMSWFRPAPPASEALEPVPGPPLATVAPKKGPPPSTIVSNCRPSNAGGSNPKLCGPPSTLGPVCG